ncbi:MAG: type II toxin-antitoxin system YafQ family toxin [Candidatus Omnitrophica bacterium]|nr:type II toxin-antitoxin system YafQ family toxin [Candidatus Omnitrophota bacterium]
MFQPSYTKQFEKDIHLAKRRGKSFPKLKLIIETIVAGQSLDPIHRDHKLAGDYVGRIECHIESDWLVIYKISGDLVIFERTGTHSDLFR